MLKIRIEGLPGDVQAAVDRLYGTFVIIEEAPIYPNRIPSEFMRRYLTVALDKTSESASICKEERAYRQA